MRIACDGPQMRVLLVEDEPNAARMIAKCLREHAYAVDIARDGDTAVDRLRDVEYDIVVLDVLLPGRDGLSVCRDLRSAGSSVPVLMLTARDSVEARVSGLDSGADDYLTKPFDVRELLARVRALARRKTPNIAPEQIVAGALVLNTRTHEASLSGHSISLTAREYALLECLCQRAGDLVTRREISMSVWDDSYDPLSNVIDVYIQRLRRKLEAWPNHPQIRTRRGEGYQLMAENGELS